MSVDVYAPCPCGSGKKLKFCCHAVVGEMDRVWGLVENNQVRMAIQALEALEKSHPGTAWVSGTRALLLMQEGQPEAAKQTVEPLLEQQPEHPLALVLHATAMFATEGYEAARPAIHRVLQRSGTVPADMLANLAYSIAAYMRDTGRAMAARQYLTLAMRIVPEEGRQEIFMGLLQFDGGNSIAYPLRSVHSLARYAGDEEIEKEAAKAQRLADIGCYQPAARMFGKLAEREPDNAALWQNAGLCRAWDGDETRAAAALHEAARRHADRETAVECETLAQLLESNTTDDLVHLRGRVYHVSSVARLLGRLAGHERMNRLELPPETDDEDAEPQPAAHFQVLDRPVPDEPLTMDNIPCVIADLRIFDADEDFPARASLMGFEGEPLDTASRLLEEAAGEFLERKAPGGESSQDPALDAMAREDFAMAWRWMTTRQVPLVTRRDWQIRKWEQLVDDAWFKLPLAALGGRSPEEAAGDRQAEVPLLAAMYVLDARTDGRGHVLDVPALCGRLGIEPPRPLEVDEGTPMSSFSVMQLHRLPVARLSDGQLHYVLNRALLIRHSGFLYEVLQEAVRRPACMEKVEVSRVYQTLSDLCRDRNERDEALRWIEQGREHARTQPNSFEQVLQWDIRELTLRLEDPQDPRLQPLMRHLHDYYGRKLPQMQSYVLALAEAFGVPTPWAAEETPGEVGSTTAGGIWTPAPASEQGERKLWIPGQD